jgi:aspartyl-tRNA(Asn)/glutamyl-tRNA(Gln) amidotransferase subunit A
MAVDQLCYLTIAEAAAGLRRRDFSAIELTDACLDRIGAIDGKIHSFITLTADLALEQARQADKELRGGIDHGPLHGIPIALKDLYATKNIRTTCHSAVLENWIPDHDATTVV